MSGLSDEEILRRVAEIEGFVNGAEVEWDWNPLTNDAQAMGLVKKYRCGVINPYEGKEEWSVLCESAAWCADESLNRAICLAIIEAHQ